MRLCVVAFAIGGLAGCRVAGTFACERDDQCTRGAEVGTCALGGYCAFADGDCTSGRRYDDYAGGGLAGQCLDQPPDAMPPDADCAAGVEFGTGTFGFCVVMAPTSPRTLTGMLDTDGAAMCDAVLPQIGGPDMCVVTGTTVSVPAAFRAFGSRPLVIAATGTIDVPGAIDVASHAVSTVGAGGSSTACDPSTPGTAGNNSGGGGGGGSFGTRGGDGGRGNAGGTMGIAGLAVTSPPPYLRGGCPGGAGGAGGGTGGPSGGGGGAVYLVSNATITISGSINASGAAGGRGVNSQGGGGGAGSGGMIVIYAQGGLAIVSGAKLIANGGGGGSGSNGTTDGADGAEPSVGSPTSKANGGGGASGGGGGDGAAGSSTASSGGGNNESGGGGGGGLGVIHLLSLPTTNLGTLSPAPT